MKRLRQIFQNPKATMLIAVIGFVIVQIVVARLSLSFLFEGNFEQHRLWFPRGYVFSYLFFAILFPLLYGWWLWGCTTSLKREWRIGLLALQTVVVIALQRCYGFYAVSAYAVLLMAVAVFVFRYIQKIVQSILLKKIIGGSFLFMLYIVLCTVLPRSHPFAKYAMFNKFPNVTYVYSLRNENNELVPIEKYSRLLKHDDLFAYSVFINEQHAFSYGNNSEKPNEEAQVCRELMQLFLENLNPNHPPFKTITLYKTTFVLQNGKPVKTETPLCAYVVE